MFWRNNIVRTHFTIIVSKSGSSVTSSAALNTSESSGKLVFNTSNIVRASLSNGVYTPVYDVSPSAGQIMIFENIADNSRTMVYYNEATKEWKAI